MLKLRYANDNVGLQNQHLLFAQWTLFVFTIAIYNFCTHNCKGYPDKIQIFHNTNRTKYNTKIKTKTKYKSDKMQKYKHEQIQKDKIQIAKIQV